MRSSHAWTQRLFGALVCFLLVVLGIAAPGAAGAAPVLAGAARNAMLAPSSSTSSNDITVTIASLSPSVLTSTSGTNVTATVHNGSASPLSGANVELAVGKTPLDSREAQRRWIDGDGTLSTSAKGSASVSDLGPGESTKVQLSIDSATLAQSFAMASLPLKVTLTRGSTELASVKTFAEAMESQSSVTPVKASIIVPLTLPADPRLLTARGDERIAAWRKAIGPGSRIDSLLSTTTSTPVTWLIDPALLSAAPAQDPSLPRSQSSQSGQSGQTEGPKTSDSASASGSASPAGSPSTSPSASATPSPSPSASSSASPSSGPSASPSASGSTAASPSASTDPTEDATQLQSVEGLTQRLIDKLKARPSSQQVWFTPYGDPDLSMLTSERRPAGSDAVLKRVLGRGLPASLTQISSTVVAAPVAPLSAGATERLRSAWKAARSDEPLIVTPTATFDGAPDATTTSAARTTADEGQFLGYDSGLSRLFTSSDESDESAAQAIRAQLMAIYQEQPSAERSVIVMGDRSTMTASRLNTVGAGLSDLPWVSPQATPSTIPADAPRVQLSPIPPDSATVFPQASSDGVNGADLSVLTRSLRDLRTYASALKNSGDIVPGWAQNVDQIAGTRWRGNSPAVDALVKTTDEGISSIPERVSVVPSNINFFTDSGRLTVSLKNDLGRDVDAAKLTLNPRSYAVRFRAQPSAFDIPANGRASVRVDAVAQASGVVTVTTSLKSRNGVTFGPANPEAQSLTINARPTSSWIFWVLGIVAFTVFCYGLLRIRQKGARRRDELAGYIKL